MHDFYLEARGIGECTLDQFLMWYKDKANDEDETENQHNDNNPLVVTSLDYLGPPHRLPKDIVLQSGKLLTLRKTPTIVSYPTPEEGSEDYVRLNVALYHPHRSLDEIQLKRSDLMKIFAAKDVNPMKNGRGMELTKLETVRSVLHPQMNQKY